MATCSLHPVSSYGVSMAMAMAMAVAPTKRPSRPCLLSPAHFFLQTHLFLPISSPFSSPLPRNQLYPFCALQEAPDLPPSSREEALLQARSSLANLLDKALRNSGPSTVRQRKLQRQLRFRVEIPLLDDSVSARASLLLDLLAGFTVGKRGDPVSFAVFCDSNMMDELETARRAGKDSKIRPYSLASAPALAEDAQVVVLVSPKLSDLTCIENITKIAAVRPVVMLNPEWSAEKETETQFVQSFDVVYSYTPLAIQGIFSKTEGAVLKHVRSGAPAGRPWLIFVKDGKEMKCVSSLKKRPNAVDLENALYSSMAANSPVTKSLKFLRGLTGGR